MLQYLRLSDGYLTNLIHGTCSSYGTFAGKTPYQLACLALLLLVLLGVIDNIMIKPMQGNLYRREVLCEDEDEDGV